MITPPLRGPQSLPTVRVVSGQGFGSEVAQTALQEPTEVFEGGIWVVYGRGPTKKIISEDRQRIFARAGYWELWREQIKSV